MCLFSSFCSLNPRDKQCQVQCCCFVLSHTWSWVQTLLDQVTLWKTSPIGKILLAVETRRFSDSSVSEKLLLTHRLSQRNKYLMWLLLQDCTFISNRLFWRGECTWDEFGRWERRFSGHSEGSTIQKGDGWAGGRHLSLTFTAECGPWSCLLHEEASPEPWGAAVGRSAGKGLHEFCLLQIHTRGCWRADLTQMLVVTFDQWNTSLSEPHSFRAMALQSIPGMQPGSRPMQKLFDVALGLLLHSWWC